MLTTRRTAVLAACAVAIGATSVTAASASAALTIPFVNWAVWGSLTPKKLNEPVVLPKGSTFNGGVEFTELSATGTSGSVFGKIFVPPFKAKLKLGGVVPTTVGVTFTQVGEATGSVVSAPDANCPRPRFKGYCVTLSVTSKANIGITGAGLAGVEVPTECKTSEPITLALSTTRTLPDLTSLGGRFTGTVTIPSIKCEGLQGIVVGAVVTQLMSGPGNPYAINLFRHEPAPPEVGTEPATSISQISARMNARVDPSGEPETDCHFEYGTSTSYSASVPCVPRPGRGFQVFAPVTGLGEEATYHYRIVSTNSLGTSVGGDQTFTTLGQAGSPEYGQCVAQKQGEYTGSSCLQKSPKPHKGKFEWKPGPAPTCIPQKKGEYTDSACTAKSVKPGKGTFEKQAGPRYTSTSGPLTLETPGAGDTLACAAGTGAGEITGAKTGAVRITFTGCELSGKKCTSEGPSSTPSGKAGAIVTNLLRTKLLGPVDGSVWTEFLSSEHEPYLAEFGCEGLQLRVRGSSSGVQTGNISLSSPISTTAFAAEESSTVEGEQALVTELSADGGKSWTGPEASSFVVELTNTSELSTEIKR